MTKGLAGYVLHDGDGTLPHERDGHRVGAYGLARDAAGGVGGVETGRRRSGTMVVTRLWTMNGGKVVHARPEARRSEHQARQRTGAHV